MRGTLAVIAVAFLGMAIPPAVSAGEAWLSLRSSKSHWPRNRQRHQEVIGKLRR
jgi:hypothetical protein